MVDPAMPSLEHVHSLAVNSMPPGRYADGSLLVEPHTQ
jgi:hypothetical protein